MRSPITPIRRLPMTTAPRKPGGVRRGCGCQITLMLCLALFLFIFGVSLGIRFSQEVDSEELEGRRPWLAWTRTTFSRVLPVPAKSRRLPPGMVGSSKMLGVGEGSLAGSAPGGGTSLRGGAGTGGVGDKPLPVDAPLGGDKGGVVEGGVVSTSPPSIWGEVSGKTLTFQGVSDSEEVSGGAWVYLPSSKTTNTINMILSNRASGCVSNDEHRGYSFYVNNWETSDSALVVEWGEGGGGGSVIIGGRVGSEGCGRLSSEKGTIPRDTWVHVAFALSAKDGKAMLFLNGALLRVGPLARGAKDIQTASSLLALGNSQDGTFPFIGRVAQVFVAATVLTPRQLSATASLVDAVGWVSMAKAAGGDFLGLVVLSGGELQGVGGEGGSSSPLAAPPGLSGGGGIKVGVAGLSSSSPLLLVELTGNLAPQGLSPLPSPEELAKKAEADAKAAATAAELFKDLTPTSGAPRSRRPNPPTGPPKLPNSIGRGPISGTAPAASFDFSDGGNQWVRRMIHDPAAKGSVLDPVALASGEFSDSVTAEELAASDVKGRERALAVKAAMAHAWKNYRERAWGMDELKPQSGRGENNWAGVGMTLVDSLDTLFIMGMTREFTEARDWVAANLNFALSGTISVFEVTIRCLGGLLAAFDLTSDAVFLTKAIDLGTRLLPAFNTPSGIPRATVSLSNGGSSNPGWTGGSSILSELGTLQVEFRYLSRASGNKEFGEKAERVIEVLDRVNKPANGLFPIYVSPDTGQTTTSTVAFGALGDSFFEYLVKVWVQGGRQEPLYRRMYDTAMNGMTSILLKRSTPSNLAYVADYDGYNTQDKMDHLVCFVPGMLALGAYNAAGTPGEENALRDLRNAKALAYTCWQMYERMATGISAEFVVFPGGADLVASESAPFYILRPEASEALFILHQLTGNPIYREWGWKMFQAIEKYCKTTYGYGAHPDVRDTRRNPDDRMESFFLAETLKYLYMLQSPDHPISLDKYVFNTEAHPLSVWS